MQFYSSARAADENFDYLFKVILIGDSNVGKTCVVQHFKSGVYTETQQNTIGVDFTVRSLEIDGKKVKMQVWDTAGQERFRTITQSYYRSAHAAIIAYDLTRPSTFESVPHWIHEIEKYGAANLVIMLIGRRPREAHCFPDQPPLRAPGVSRVFLGRRWVVTAMDGT
ncbi:RAB19, member RAS oncogene family [Ictidomys tridecemlineatus]|uniref:ras-related protein Rab-19 n=1 Tax=Ictidomys tridecemlineatus TaxID=43179 RepID=UPI00038C2E7F|nr:ras-related protein Rab-19 [Ictidomys tridecemlineatus]KAG3277367.1 RAB19, member RAS oncogene family [Ictidomys tridecemlineatus]